MAHFSIDIYSTANHSEDRALYLKVVVLGKKGRLQEVILVYSNLIHLMPKYFLQMSYRLKRIRSDSLHNNHGHTSQA